jgi:riboflavin kinase/FMN adenylyltransferase
MIIIGWEELISRSRLLPGCVSATIGVFDGIHIGHQKLMRAIADDSARTTPVVVTFRDNPATILHPDASRGSILSTRQKNAKMAALGVGVVVLIDFSLEFSTLTGKNFIGQLRNCLDLRKIVVGYNFHFGRNKDTEASGLERMLEGSGIEVEVMQPSLYDHEVVSSSRLRCAILEGRFSQARTMLAADYTVDLLETADVRRAGDVVEVHRHSLCQLLPKKGRYSAVLLTDTGGIETRVEISSRALSWKTNDPRTINEIRFVEPD